MPYHESTGIYFEAYGDGEGVFFGPPLTATTTAAEQQIEHLKHVLIDALGRECKLLFVDYPYGKGRTKASGGEGISAATATQDLVQVASAAGLDRFTWYGYSWGAVLGFQLALQTRRLSGLIAGGFPPVDGPYRVMLDTCRFLVEHPPPDLSANFLKQYVRYYESLEGFCDKSAIAKINIPRLIYAGMCDVVDCGAGQANIGEIVRANKKYLEQLGWQVRLLPRQDHSSALDAAVVFPLVHAFLQANRSG
jgi:pimeloyl-ACP methyl ester carboxylesterase